MNYEFKNRAFTIRRSGHKEQLGCEERGFLELEI
jgi:hypothetical protein